MSYSKLQFEETYNTLRVYSTEVTSRFNTTYKIYDPAPSHTSSVITPEMGLIHFNTITGSFSVNPTINVGFTPPYYNDWITSGTVDVSSRVAGNMYVYSILSNVSPSSSAPSNVAAYVRWNTNNTTQFLTASFVLLAFESQAF
jgi:hypothetical protein